MTHTRTHTHTLPRTTARLSARKVPSNCLCIAERDCAYAFSCSQEWLDQQKEFASLPKETMNVYVQVSC